MQYISYKNNDIVSVKQSFFGNLKKLKEIILSNNSIRLLDIKMFYSHESLLSLDVSSNKIVSFEGDFGLITKLSTLNLGNNAFEELRESVFRNYFTTALDTDDRHFVLDGNTFNCGCEMTWIREVKIRIIMEFKTTKTLCKYEVQLSCFVDQRNFCFDIIPILNVLDKCGEGYSMSNIYMCVCVFVVFKSSPPECVQLINL